MIVRRVEGAGVELAVHEHGTSGPTVVVVHGLAGDAEAWASSAARLQEDGVRVVTYDRRGYGDSGAPDHYVGTSVEEQAEDAAAVLRAEGDPRSVVLGDGFGALVALDLAKRHRGLVRAVALGHPPLFAFVPEAAAALAAERFELEEALRAGGPEHAVATWLGPGEDPARVARARRHARAFFADFAGLASWPVTRRELRALDLPVAVVTHPLAPRHVLAAATKLTELLSDARRREDGDVVAAAAALALE